MMRTYVERFTHHQKVSIKYVARFRKLLFLDVLSNINALSDSLITLAWKLSS